MAAIFYGSFRRRVSTMMKDADSLIGRASDNVVKININISSPTFCRRALLVARLDEPFRASPVDIVLHRHAARAA